MPPPTAASTAAEPVAPATAARSAIDGRTVRIAIPVLLAAAFFAVPAPHGLAPAAWRLFGIFISTILMIMLQALPEPSAVFIGVASAAVAVVPLQEVLVGYVDQTVWLIVTAVMMSVGFKKSGLAKRIGLVLITRFGKSSLSLGYVLASMDLLLATTIPAAPARTGGLVYPLSQGILEAFEERQAGEARRLGSYLTVLLYMVSMVTGSLFMTGMAPNVLNATLGAKILGVQLTWPMWTAAALPGFLGFLVIPLLVHRFSPPRLESIANVRALAGDELKALGRVTRSEWIVAGTFVLALVLWATSSLTHVNITVVSFLGATLLIVAGAVQWKDIAETKETWSILIWFGGIIGLSAALEKHGFFKWLVTVLQSALPLQGASTSTVLVVVALLAILPHYVFPSLVGYVATLSPVIFSVVAATQAPRTPAVLLVCFLMVISSTVTHYGNGLGPLLIESGHVRKSTWWKIGLVVTVLMAVVYLTIGVAYWRLIGLG